MIRVTITISRKGLRVTLSIKKPPKLRTKAATTKKVELVAYDSLPGFILLQD